MMDRVKIEKGQVWSNRKDRNITSTILCVGSQKVFVKMMDGRENAYSLFLFRQEFELQMDSDLERCIWCS